MHYFVTEVKPWYHGRRSNLVYCRKHLRLGFESWFCSFQLYDLRQIGEIKKLVSSSAKCEFWTLEAVLKIKDDICKTWPSVAISQILLLMSLRPWTSKRTLVKGLWLSWEGSLPHALALFEALALQRLYWFIWDNVWYNERSTHN